NFDFLGKRRLCFGISAVLVLCALGGFALQRKDALGIDFTGGTLTTFQLGDEVEIPLEDVQQAVAELDLTRQAFAQEANNITTGTTLSVRSDTADADQITAKLRKVIPELTAQDESGDYLIPA